jgi:hypothetical protein
LQPTEGALFLHVGAHVEKVVEAGGYNGGGLGAARTNDGPGGGATDFRTASGPWNESLESRIIVAGGGGGSYIASAGGPGGGVAGEDDVIVSDNLGVGGSRLFGCGGGGYYGGLSRAFASNAGSGGSGYVDGVVEVGEFKRKTVVSGNRGHGWARVTILFPSICNTLQRKVWSPVFIILSLSPISFLH